MVNILKVVSPNRSKRRGVIPSAVVAHYSAGLDAEDTVRWLTRPEARASYHFIISRTGRIWNLVDPEYAAWHCEPAELLIAGDEITSQANRHSLSVCLANCGLLRRDTQEGIWRVSSSDRPYPDKYPVPEHGILKWDSVNVPDLEGWWEPYTAAQMLAFEELIKKECGNLPVIGHDEVAMPLGRKKDPGPLFPMQFRRQWPRCWRGG